MNYGDPMVHHPQHYSSSRFGVECIAFTRLMPFCAGNAFKYVWRCEDKGSPVQDLEKALVYLEWASESGHASALPREHRALTDLYWEHLKPKQATDWMARVLGDIIWGNWNYARSGIKSRHAFFVLNGGHA